MNLKASRLIGPLLAVLILIALCLSAAQDSEAQDDPAAPPVEAPETAVYVGSDACKLCHAKVYEEWIATSHSKLLTASGVGEDKKGCEACHGPGSLHVGSTGKVKFPVSAKEDPKAFAAVCSPCHIGSLSTVAPKEWQKLDAKYWGRSEHSRKGISCQDCHIMHTSSPKLLKQNENDLCVTCHSRVLAKSEGKKGAYTHFPVAQKQCTLCHDPHGASPRQLVRPKIQAICESCHKADSALNKTHGGINIASSDCTDCHLAHSHDNAGSLIKKNQHGPFKAADCDSCHKTSDVSNTVALIKPEKELCISCHSKDVEQAPGAHRPVAEGMCTTCHSPHFSTEPKLLKGKSAHVCLTCHSKIEAAMDAKFKHKPMESQDCVQCHTPHSSPEPGLLKKASIDLCKDCHEPHLHPLGTKKDGSVVIDPTTKKMLVCTSCHEPHGGNWQHLTRDNPERELCVRCHGGGPHG